MLNLIKYIPFVLSLLKRAKVLVNASNSNTTAKQKLVAMPVALVVALLGYFIPELADDTIAFALVAALVGYIAPYVSRFIAYQQADEKENMLLMLVAVRENQAKAWYSFTGTLVDAGEEGIWKQGLTSDGSIYEIGTGKFIDTIKLKGDTQEESNAKMKQFMDAIRNSKTQTEIKYGTDN